MIERNNLTELMKNAEELIINKFEVPDDFLKI